MNTKTVTETENSLFVRTFAAACSFLVFTVLIGFINLLLYPIWLMFIMFGEIETWLYSLQEKIQNRMINIK